MEIWQQQDSPCGNKEQVRQWVLQEISRNISRAEGNLGIGGDVKKPIFASLSGNIDCQYSSHCRDAFLDIHSQLAGTISNDMIQYTPCYLEWIISFDMPQGCGRKHIPSVKLNTSLLAACCFRRDDDGNDYLFTPGEGKNSDDVARQSRNKEGNTAGKAK